MFRRTAPFALLALVTAAHGETLQCTTINSVPYTIAASGNYCLTANLTSSVTGTAAAITINADNVLLDLNDHQLTGPGGANPGYGIAAVDHRGIHVRNGRLRGFSRGINFADSFSGFPPITPSGLSSRHEIEHLRVEGGTIAIGVVGRSSVHDNLVMDATQTGIYGNGEVSRNRVFNTVGASGATAPVYGISVAGAGSVVEDNVVSTLRGPAFSTAIYANGLMVLSGNRESDYGDIAINYSVNCNSSSFTVVKDNLAVGTHFAGIPLMGQCSFQ